MSLPALLIIALAALGVYSIAMSRVSDQVPAALQRLYLVSFVVGLLAALAIFIPSPDLFGPDHRFTVSMAQFLLAVDVGPLLLFGGIPAGMLQPLLQRGWLQRLIRPQVTGPVSVVVLLGWFIPVFFEAASGNLALWILKQALFLIAGLLFWWPVDGPLLQPRPTYSVQLVYLFAMRLPMTALGVLITFSSKFIYSSRSISLEICAPSSLADQQAGGLVMWTVGGLVLFSAFAIIFYHLLKERDASQSKEF